MEDGSDSICKRTFWASNPTRARCKEEQELVAVSIKHREREREREVESSRYFCPLSLRTLLLCTPRDPYHVFLSLSISIYHHQILESFVTEKTKVTLRLKSWPLRLLQQLPPALMKIRKMLFLPLSVVYVFDSNYF